MKFRIAPSIAFPLLALAIAGCADLLDNLATLSPNPSASPSSSSVSPTVAPSASASVEASPSTSPSATAAPTGPDLITQTPGNNTALVSTSSDFNGKKTSFNPSYRYLQKTNYYVDLKLQDLTSGRSLLFRSSDTSALTVGKEYPIDAYPGGTTLQYVESSPTGNWISAGSGRLRIEAIAGSTITLSIENARLQAAPRTEANAAMGAMYTSFYGTATLY